MIETNNSHIDVAELMERVRARAAEFRRIPARQKLPPVPTVDPLATAILPQPVSTKTEHILQATQSAREATTVSSWIPKPLRGLFRRQDKFNDQIIRALEPLAKTSEQLADRLRHLTACAGVQDHQIHHLAELRRMDAEWMNTAAQLTNTLQNQVAFRSQVVSVEQKANSLEERFSDLAGDIEELTRKAADFEELRGSTTALVEALSHFQQEKKELFERTHAIQSRHEELSAHLATLADKIDDVHGRTNSHGGHLHELQTRADQNAHDLKELQGQAEGRRQDLARLQSETTALSERVGSIQHHHDRLVEQATQLQDRQRQLGSQVEHVEAHLSNLQSQADNQGTHLHNLQAETEATRERHTRQDAEFEHAGAHLNNLQNQADTQGTHLSNLQSQADNEGIHLHNLQGEADAIREQLARQGAELEAAKARIHEIKQTWLRAEERQISEAAFLKSELSLLSLRLGDLSPASTDSPRPVEPAAAETNHQLDALYVAFEDQFRGSRELITKRLQPYLNDVSELKVVTEETPLLDLGCGRGEWLELLKAQGFAAEGIDLNTVFAGLCGQRGLRVSEADALAYLRSLPEASRGAITAFHLIEHLPFPILVELLRQSLRVLCPGGLVIFETPNPDNMLVGSNRFYTDPTHLHPLPKEYSVFLLESVGFTNVAARPLNPDTDSLSEEAASPELRNLLNRLFYGDQDYAVMGRKSVA